MTAPGTLEPRPLLPSFLYLATAEELAGEGFALPWGAPPNGAVVGTLAARRAAEAPDRVVSSAKSWLCNARVDRTAPILPWVPESGVRAARRGGVGGAALLAARGLDRLPGAPPRRLEPRRRRRGSRAAPRAAGDPPHRARLVRRGRARADRRAAARRRASRASPARGAAGGVLRVARGAGDALARAPARRRRAPGLRRRRRHHRLQRHARRRGGRAASRSRASRSAITSCSAATTWTWRSPSPCASAWRARASGSTPGSSAASSSPAARRRSACSATSRPTSVPLAILGRGTKLIGGTIRAELTRDEVDALLLDGFLPVVDATARAAASAEAGLSELGLPYAADPAITRHLARFLSTQRTVAGGRRGAPTDDDGLIRPTRVLFNGGVLKAAALQQRVADVLGAWARAAQAPAPRVLPRQRPRPRRRARRRVLRPGAARPRRAHPRRHGALVLRRRRERVPAVPGQPPPVKALCVVPFGMEEGTEPDVPGAEFGLLVGEPARFRFFGSTTRSEDAVGPVLDEWDTAELEELAPLERATSTASRQRSRAGAAAAPRHRDRHARAVVRRARRRRALEARVHRARNGRRIVSEAPRRPPRYVVGIDLGTTNSAVASARTAGARRPAIFPIAAAGGGGRDPGAPVAAVGDLPRRRARRRRRRARAAVARGSPLRRRRRSRAGSAIASPAASSRRRSPGSATAASTGRRRSCRGAAIRTVASCRRSRRRPRVLEHVREAWDAAHPDAPLRRAGRRPHRAGVVRRGRARAHGAGGGDGRARRAYGCSRSRRRRSTPGSVRIPAGASSSRRTARCWWSTSAAARPTSR